ncbi:MAG: CvpA family protein, partial [Pseudomonadota bacterium]
SREVLSVGSWAAAGAAGAYVFLYDEPLTPFVQTYVENELIAQITATGITFLLTLIIVSFITMRISDFIIDSSIGALDRTLGFIFGAARGLLLIVIAMGFFNWFQPENQPAWIADARSKPFIDQMVVSLTEILPEDVEALVSFGKDRLTGTTSDVTPQPDDGTKDRQGLDNLIDNQGN